MSQSSERGGVRHLELIQEEEPRALSSRVAGLLLASVGGACIVFAALALARSPARPKATPEDPLSDLLARARPGMPTASAKPQVGERVTFPGALSDRGQPTTALAAVPTGHAIASAPAALTPPPALDQLPVVPLPAQHHVVDGEAPAGGRDVLTVAARRVSREEGVEVRAGTAGGYQLQVSSFKQAAEAEAFAAVLRRRGHRAYVEAAEVQGRGTWHRVRIGPFKHKHEATLYRQDFEAKERIVTFVVDPPKTKVAIARLSED
jgi:DedD protein